MELFDPSGATEVTDINTVPADFRWMYKADSTGAKHTLNAEDAPVKSALSVFSSLKGALTRSRADLKTAQGTKIDLTPLNAYGATVEEIATKFNEKVELLTGQIKGVDPKKIAEGVAKEWEPKLTAEQNRSKALTQQLYKVLFTGEAATAIAAEKGVPELLMPFVAQQVKVVENNGEFAVHVIDASGETRYSGAAPMTIAGLVKEMKTNTKFGRLFESEAPGGTGTKPGQQQRNHTQPANAEHQQQGMSSTDKIAAGLAKGQAVSNRKA